MIRAKPKRDEPGTSNSEQQQPQLEPDMREEIEAMSSNSDQMIAVPAINFKR